MESLTARLPHLARLAIESQPRLQSLRFLSAESLSGTRWSNSNSRTVLACVHRRFRLCIAWPRCDGSSSFDAALDEETLATFALHSRLMPKLGRFQYQPREEAASEEPNWQ
jgi:hypothetical protein